MEIRLDIFPQPNDESLLIAGHTVVVLQLDGLACEAQLWCGDARHRAQRRVCQQLRARWSLRPGSQ
jgi:hypothetical protein